MTTLRKLLLPFTAVLVLAWAGLVLAQNSQGGVFQPGLNYIIGGQWTWRAQASPFVFEGTTDDASETTWTVTDPTADRTITFQNATGTVMVANATTAGGVRAGLVTLDGSNPTSVTTGLSALAGCSANLDIGTTPGLGPITLTIIRTAVAGRLDIYAWNATSTSNPTLVASTSGLAATYVCVGTP